MQVTKNKRAFARTANKPGKSGESPARHWRSPCPIGNLLDFAGDKWSLLIVRDLLRGFATYGELAASPEGIPTNILADRLKRLEKVGVIRRVPYRKRPLRYSYRLTEKGKGLQDVLDAIVRWSKKHIAGVKTFEDLNFKTQRCNPRLINTRSKERY